MEAFRRARASQTSIVAAIRQSLGWLEVGVVIFCLAIGLFFIDHPLSPWVPWALVFLPFLFARNNGAIQTEDQGPIGDRRRKRLSTRNPKE
jgi:hypothetical protein